MRYTLVKSQQTVVLDTTKFTTFEEWLHLLREVGNDMFELSAQIENAKLRRSQGKGLIPAPEWQRINRLRQQRIREWRTLADHMIFMWPEKISFTSNQFMRLVREKHESVFNEIFPLAAVEPTKARMSQEGRQDGENK